MRSGAFERLSDFVGRHCKAILVVALLATVVAGVYGSTVADRLDPYAATDPSTESVRADARIEHATGASAEPGIIAVVETRARVGSSRARARVRSVERKIAAERQVKSVVGYYDTHDRGFVSKDRRATYVLAYFRPVSDKAKQDATARILDRVEGTPGVTLGGQQVALRQINESVQNDLRRAEMLAFPILFLLSFLFFRGLIASGIPPLLGGTVVIGTFAALRLAGTVSSVSIFALNIVTGLGLGLAIDYSLFIISRYREEVARVGPGPAALRATVASAGRTVFFSGITVAAAVAAMLIFPQRFLYSMGLGGMIVTLLAVLLALIVLPALLALLGDRVNAFAPAPLRRAAEHDARPATRGFWYRLSRFVMRRPGRVALASAALLLVLGTPALRMELTPAGAETLPPGASAKSVDDMLRQRFEPNVTNGIRVVMDTHPGPRVRRFARRLARTPGVASVRPPRAAGDVTLVEAIPQADALTRPAQDTVRAIRRMRGPGDPQVAGPTAAFVDLKQSLVDHLPLALGLIVAVTMMVLFLMTGSVVLPVKQLVMNALSLAATMGILVLVFQDGRLEGLLDFTSPGAIEVNQPIFLIAAAFGLSTDYGVFLLARIKEARDRGHPNAEAVPLGLERTGRIVTAAALLFAVAVGAFATSDIVYIKELGLGIALAVLIDATLVRGLLVPSLMAMLGRLNWWSPAPLRRLHARLGKSQPAASPSPLPAPPPAPAPAEVPEPQPELTT